MLIPTIIQIKLVLYAIAAGVFTGFLFDIYRIVRGFENFNKVLTFIEDALFWIFAAILIFLFLFTTRYIYINQYLYLCIALGLYIYLKFISKSFIGIQSRILRTSGKAFRITRNVAVYPFEIIFHKLKVKNK